jgi:hypothetical protein
MSKIVIRGNAVFFSFVFLDETNAVTTADSAEVEVTYPARDGFATETISLTLTSGSWQGSWDTTNSRGGWVQYHVHAHANLNTDEFAQDGRFLLKANRANLQHILLPTGLGLNDIEPVDYA